MVVAAWVVPLIGAGPGGPICAASSLLKGGSPQAGGGALKRFAELIRQGPGNEANRLVLLDTHRQCVDAQIHALEECRSVIAWKVDVYADHLKRGQANGLWDPTAQSSR